MPVNLNGLDPRVVRALKQIQDEAQARGIETNVVSAYRTLDDQKQLYANFLAGQQGQPLPFPDRGAVPLAAAPGTSLHEKGFAFDLEATDPSKQAQLWDIGHTLGLRTIGSKDPSHFELANVYTGGDETAHPGISNSRFLEALQHFESGGRNIPNVHQGTSSGQAQGYNQITTGTWNEFGGTKYAPDALHATKEQQDEIASSIPLRRWAPETLDYLKQQGFKLDPNKTLGENIAMNGGTVPSGGSSGGSSVASAPAGGDWQSLLGAEAPPQDASLGSMLSDAVSPSTSRAPTPAMTPVEPEQPIDINYALASTPVEELGARYQQGKETRKLSPLSQLFSLPTIGPQQPKTPTGPQPLNLGVG